MKNAYFAGGCFWCITPGFRSMDGVAEVVSGYSCGTEQNPVYADVKAQRTGHRETIAIRYDPDAVSYESLLAFFLQSIDPFDGEGQFIDRGHSYTTAVYYSSEEERIVAEQAIAALAASSGREVPIAVEPFTAFWPAEEYHQNYDLKNPEAFEKELIESGRKKA